LLILGFGYIYLISLLKIRIRENKKEKGGENRALLSAEFSANQTQTPGPKIAMNDGVIWGKPKKA
jgi:hypothetical protein